MKWALILLLLVVFIINSASGQSDFFLKDKKSGRLIKLKPTTNFGFQTMKTDTSKSIRYFGRITQMTDSAIVIEEYVKPSLRPAIAPRMFTIRLRQIKSVKNYLIDNDDFNTLGGMLIIGGALGAVLTPIVLIAEGEGAAKDGAVLTAGLFAAGGFLLLPQHIGKRRHMTKWEFVKQ
jgi:hypothetical protein